MAESIQLSSTAHKRLSDEFQERTTSRRREITDRIEEARQHGDLKENAEYHAAKDDQGHNEARIRQLEDILKRSEVIEQSVTANCVAAGCLVEIRIAGDDDTTTYLVGSIEERHDDFDVLSPSSPIGLALKGASVGDTVTYQGPRREITVTVVTISVP